MPSFYQYLGGPRTFWGGGRTTIVNNNIIANNNIIEEQFLVKSPLFLLLYAIKAGDFHNSVFMTTIQPSLHFFYAKHYFLAIYIPLFCESNSSVILSFIRKYL